VNTERKKNRTTKRKKAIRKEDSQGKRWVKERKDTNIHFDLVVSYVLVDFVLAFHLASCFVDRFVAYVLSFHLASSARQFDRAVFEPCFPFVLASSAVPLSTAEMLKGTKYINEREQPSGKRNK
jgi:hypothetical protein